MKKIIWILVAVCAITAIYITLYHPDTLVEGSAVHLQSATIKPAHSVKTPETNTAEQSTTNTGGASTTVNQAAPAKATAPVTTGTGTPAEPPAAATPDCAPTATVEDPCKLGQCFGYPYGICESNPNQGQSDKCYTDCTNPDANYFDLWGNEFTYNGTLIQYSTECVDPISGSVNPYNPSCQ